MGTSPLLTLSFSAVVVAVITALVAGVWLSGRGALPPSENRRATLIFAASLSAWLAFTGLLARSGVLQDFESRPPKMFLVVAAGAALASIVAFGRIGRRAIDALPLWSLVLLQGFRFPLELVLHRAYSEGVMPIQMSFSGRNFDILTGITALGVALLAYRQRLPAWALQLWNLAGFGLLLNVVTVAILSFPAPFRVFETDPPNVWVTHFPFVWLPAMLVMTALFGHLLVVRIGLSSLASARGRAPSSPTKSGT